MSGIRNVRVLVVAAVVITAFIFLVSTNERLSSTLVPGNPYKADAPDVDEPALSPIPAVTQAPALVEQEAVTLKETIVQTATKTVEVQVPAQTKGAAPTKSKVLVVLPKDKRTGGDFGFRDGGWLESAMENRQEYADAHGYEFIWQDLSTFHPEYDYDACWAKIAALQDAWIKYPEVDWIWMLDADAIIMNANIDLHDHLLSHETLKKVVLPDQEVRIPGGHKIDEQKDKTVRTRKDVVPEEIEFLIAMDGNGINAGSFFVKRTEFMSGVIDFWKDPYLMKAGFGYREQDALGHLMLFHKQFLDKVGIIPQKLVNEYVDRLNPDDFVVHFAGCSFYKDRDCDALFRQKWDSRIRAKKLLEGKPENSHNKATGPGQDD